MTAGLGASRSASARAVRIAHLEELVRLRNTLDAEITAELRAFAQDEVDARIEEVLDDRSGSRPPSSRNSGWRCGSRRPGPGPDCEWLGTCTPDSVEYTRPSRAGSSMSGRSPRSWPTEHGVACYAALHNAVTEHWVSTEPVTRTRGQIMADTLVERLTGRDPAEPVQIEIHVLVPVESLLGPHAPLPAEIPGYGPTDLLDRAACTSWRRLVTTDGIVIGGDSRPRAFGGVLADLIRSRDRGHCTEPGCAARIEHLDHVRRHSRGGRTTLANGRGTCAFHNLVREQPGWAIETHPGTRTTITPTGRRYTLRL